MCPCSDQVHAPCRRREEQYPIYGLLVVRKVEYQCSPVHPTSAQPRPPQSSPVQSLYRTLGSDLFKTNFFWSESEQKEKLWTWPPPDQVSVQHQLTLVGTLQQRQPGVCWSGRTNVTLYIQQLYSQWALEQHSRLKLTWTRTWISPEHLLIWDYHEFFIDSNNADFCTVQGFYFVQHCGF